MQRLTFTILLFFAAVGETTVKAQAPTSATTITAGKGILLGQINPQLKSLKKTDLTLEFWIRPDQATIDRERALLWLFANQRGTDSACIGMSLSGGKLLSNVLGTKFTYTGPLVANQWIHVCLTVEARTLNKIATLWVNGRRVDRALISSRWPDGFFYARMMNDPWGLNRVFSGQTGPIRISSKVLYRQKFDPGSDWTSTDTTLLLLKADQIQPTE